MPRRIESQVQEACVKYARMTIPNGEALLFSVPNGGWRDKNTARTLKREGALEGASDLVLVLPGARVVFIEMKRPEIRVGLPGRTKVMVKKGVMSEPQNAFRDAVEAMGHPHRIVDSIEGFITVLNEFGVNHGAFAKRRAMLQAIEREGKHNP